MKKTLFLAAIFVFIQCAVINHAMHIRQPEVRFHDVSLSTLSLRAIELKASFTIKNPNSMGMTISGYTYTIFLENKPVIDGKIEKPQRINGLSEDTLMIPIHLSYLAIMEAIKNTVNLDTMHCQVAATIQVEMPVIGSIQIPLNKSLSLPRPRIPHLQLKQITIGHINLTGAEFVCRVMLQNRNRFPINLSDFTYHIYLNENKIGSGTINEQIHVGQMGNRSLEIPLKINFLKTGSSLMSVLKNGTSVKFKMESSTRESDSPRQFPLPLLETRTKLVR